MENVGSEKEGIRILTEIAVAKGVKRVVLSPGSRNAPLIISFVREKRISYYVVLDERSAAFFALGIAQRTGEPVALVCTSGTALLNYAPAVAEAYYQRLPLIVISADRPVEWVDQDDSQTIRQDGLFRNIVKASYSLPVEIANGEERWYANRLLNDAFNCALKGRKGPVHINVPLREPLYGKKVYSGQPERIVSFLDAAPVIGEPAIKSLAGRFSGCPKIMILVGFYPSDGPLREALFRLAGFENVVVLTETLSNIASENHINTIDRVLAVIGEKERPDYSPDLLLSFGGPLISRHVKAFLRRYRPENHWHVDVSEHPADTFQGMTLQVNLEAGAFFSQLSEQVVACPSDYAARWRKKRELAEARHAEYIGLSPWSDLKAFSILFPALPAESALQVSNSTPVRYAQLFEYRQVADVNGNRGTSGIDGSTSTAVGAACVFPGLTTLFTGDMGFIYDSNALWNRYVVSRLRIVVIKNGGGGIFRFIAGPSGLEELEECFETERDVDVKGFAALHHFRYFKGGNEDELKSVLPDFFREGDSPAILEVETPRLVNDRVLKGYFRYLAGEDFQQIMK